MATSHNVAQPGGHPTDKRLMAAIAGGRAKRELAASFNLHADYGDMGKKEIVKSPVSNVKEINPPSEKSHGKSHSIAVLL